MSVFVYDASGVVCFRREAKSFELPESVCVAI